MPRAIANTTLTDNYDDATFSFGDIFASGFLVVANNPAVMQMGIGPRGQMRWGPEMFVSPAVVPLQGGTRDAISGVRLKRFSSQTPTPQVFGTLFYPGEPTVGAGTPFTSLVTPGGAVTPAVASAGVQLDYAEIIADVAIAGTTEATATACIDGNTTTFDGSRVCIEVSSPDLDHTATGAAQGLYVILLEDATVLGIIGNVLNPTAAATIEVPLRAARFRTPTAGQHAYHVKAFRTGGSANFRAGPGGSGQFVPAFMRITRA